jgi:hypothetical protein
MLIFFSAGAAVGLSAALGIYLRQRRELARHRNEAEAMTRQPK